MSDYLQKQINEIDKKIEEARKLASADPSMAELAHEEVKKLEEEKSNLEKSLITDHSLVLSEVEGSLNTNDAKSVIVEIRAAAGGDEAGLFAQDLARMYTRFATSNNWRVEELDKNEGGIGNLKEIIYKISGKNVWDKLQFESGVHRVQRVPKTEFVGRNPHINRNGCSPAGSRKSPSCNQSCRYRIRSLPFRRSWWPKRQ